MTFLPKHQKAGIGEQGFSFVELMIAIVIMVTALIPLFSLFDYGFRMQTLGEQEQIALNLAQSKLEELLAEYFLNDHKLLVPQRSITEAVIRGQKYIFLSIIATPRGSVQEMSVEVSYKAFSRTKNVRLITRVVEY